MRSVDTETLSLWEQAALTRWGRYITETERTLFRQVNRMAGKPGTLLDVGCGEGRWTSLLHREGWKAICADVDERALAK